MEDLEEAILTGLVFPIEPKCTQSMIHKSTLLNNHSKEEGGIWPTHPPIAPLGHRRAKRPQNMVTWGVTGGREGLTGPGTPRRESLVIFGSLDCSTTPPLDLDSGLPLLVD